MNNLLSQLAVDCAKRHLVLTYVADDGKILEITPHDSSSFDVVPLSFQQLLQSLDSPSPTLPLTIHNASAPAAATGLIADGPLVVAAKLSLNGPILAYGLVDGGWLPLPMAFKRIALLDRNVVISLEKFHSSPNAKNSNWPNWLGLDAETLSPMLFALEGPNRKVPTDFQMRVELNRAVKILTSLFPAAKVQHVSTKQRKALLRTVLQHSETRTRATRLLTKAAPLVVDRVKQEHRKKLEAEVLRIAKTEYVGADSLPVIALLSCIYDGGGVSCSHRAATPGRAVLKPKSSYSAEDAYNALADLFFLELMLHIFEFFPEDHPVLYTRDVGITAFWSALQPTQRQRTHLCNQRVKITVTFRLSNGLFPSLTDTELGALKHRLGL